MQFLKELKKSKGLTRSELSKQFSVSERTVACWENGEADIYLSTAVKLTEFYGVRMDVFRDIN